MGGWPKLRGTGVWGREKGDVTTDGAFACTEKAFSGITPCSGLDTDPRESPRVRSPCSKAEAVIAITMLLGGHYY